MNLKKTTPLKLIPFLLVFFLVLTSCNALSNGTPTPAVPVQSESKTTVEARVIPIRSAILSFSGNGKVENIYFLEGVTVKKGEPIARLEGSERVKAQIAAAELQVASAQKALDDLNEKEKLAAADAEMAVALAAQELKDAKEKRDDLNYKRVHQYMLENIQSQLIIAENAVDDAETTYSYVQDRAEDDPDRARALAYLSQTRMARDQIQRSLEYAEGPPDPKDIAEADARVSKAQALLDDAKLIYERRKNSPDPRDLGLAEAGLNNAQSQLEAAQSALSDLDLTSPIEGTVIVNDLVIGEIAKPGSVMVGDTRAWQVETTDLKEVDVVDIQPGQPVLVRFDAIPGLEIEGTVNRIKGFGIDVRGDNMYTVTVDLTESDPRLLWNMTARVAFL